MSSVSLDTAFVAAAFIWDLLQNKGVICYQLLVILIIMTMIINMINNKTITLT